MTHDEQQHANPLQQLKADISALEERDRMWAAHVQVPRTRANVLAGMSEQEWHDGSGGWLHN